MNNSKQSSRLIGWLISYDLDALGKAYEIRAGRTLITSGNGDGRRTITISSSDLSAPHLAMNASAKHTLQVQDIFSEAGSFITRNGSSEEQPLSGPAEIKHGDWLRIGTKARFQLCLIDGPAR
ncbi:MAG: hypothetical protein K1X83_13040 [Oligoflexia bacterium]|nr:hypothetical protein [Oligoflexia bacterium]